MFKLFSLPTLLLASFAIGVVVSTPLVARDDGYRSATAANTKRASSFRRLASSVRTRSVSHRARSPPVLNEAGIIWAILDGERGSLYTCLERSVASIEKVSSKVGSGGLAAPGSVGWMLAFRHSRFGGQRTRGREDSDIESYGMDSGSEGAKLGKMSRKQLEKDRRTNGPGAAGPGADGVRVTCPPRTSFMFSANSLAGVCGSAPEEMVGSKLGGRRTGGLFAQ
ncbi:hypothetical protein B0H13DRAFT_2267501 [Mycena leptocephala]|nr:hypothetical protein B0H13DRAFT_2267501 [Mycena leptocephala]